MSTTVDAELLARAREIRSGGTDASLVEEALQALLRNHRAAEVDEAYARAYRETPVEAPDEWGDLTTFLDAATRR
ncbi:type II toxin-antitoxin system VapB family antitoxin [Ornithinimicrobium sp. LYQ92]|uniref:type II toxin-antitoxin system VapB family antitoxin n=1 Tax=Serinicoccus sp. LYQ92 TaxID=3378798 RepID=UPI003852EB38